MNKRYDFKEIEQRVSGYWKQNNVIEKTVKYDAKKKLFSFLEGPPTANAPPGLHHVEVRVFKDLFCRYKFMQGFSVPRKAGWDCHGLPVEVQVEKKLELKNKKEVLEYGIKKFVTECEKDVFSFIHAWVELSNRMGFWLDYENRYATLDQNYMESEWWALKQIFGKGLL